MNYEEVVAEIERRGFVEFTHNGMDCNKQTADALKSLLKDKKIVCNKKKTTPTDSFYPDRTYRFVFTDNA